jgi:kinesin family member 1
MYAHSNELEEKGIVTLKAVNVESNPDMEMLLGVGLLLFCS